MSSRISLSRVAAVSVMAALALAMSGCSPEPEREAEPSESPSLTPPSADPDLGHGVDYSLNADFGIETDGAERTDKFGTYTQVRLADDSPLFEYDESKFAPELLEIYSPEELVEGQEVAARIAIEQMMDGEAVYDRAPENVQGYRDSSRAYITESQLDEWNEGVEVLVTGENYSMDHFVHLLEEIEGVSIPPYVEGQPRFAMIKFELVKVEHFEYDDSAYFHFEVAYERPIMYEGAPLKALTETFFRIGVLPDAAGEWKMSWWNTGDGYARGVNPDGSEMDPIEGDEEVES